MSNSEPPRHGDTSLHPNPFGNGDRNREAQSWARNIASAESVDKSRTTSRDLDKEKTEQSSDEDHHLDPMETVKTAAHIAKQKLHLHSISAKGPSKFLNPTNVRVHVKWKGDDDESSKYASDEERSAGDIFNERAYLWRSRDNRKGRNSIAVPTSVGRAPLAPIKDRFMTGLTKILRILARMIISFPYWDMSFWSGWSYTWGSVLFVMDGAWSWKKEAQPGSEPKGLTKYGAPLCFFFGAMLYQVGATMAYLEAVNDGSFQGSAMQRFLDGNEEHSKELLDAKIHSFFGHFVPHIHHRKKGSAVDSVDPEAGWRMKDRHERPGSNNPQGKSPPPRRGAVDHGETEKGTSEKYYTWRWWPTWHALGTHHVYEIGYLACAIQLLGATLYGVTGVVDLPGILDGLADWQEEAAFWIPQIVASVCFLTASILFTLETQEKWWRPEPTVIGWWIGVWALIGSVGFL